MHAQPGSEEAELLDQPLAVTRTGGEDCKRFSGRSKSRQRKGIAGSDEPADAAALAGRGNG
jgi:hypothetical protein